MDILNSVPRGNGQPAGCDFCDELDPGRFQSSRYASFGGQKERSIALGEGYFLIPSLGPLARGHSLLVPEIHVHSLANLNDPRGASRYLSVAMDLVESRFGKVLVFEHGTRSKNSSGGCGVRHAHTHLVPSGGASFTEPPAGYEFEALDPEVWLSQLSLLHPDDDYMFYWPPGSRPLVAFDSSVPSQFLRKFTASILETDEWDWRNHPSLAGIDEVVEELKIAASRYGSKQPV